MQNYNLSPVSSADDTEIRYFIVNHDILLNNHSSDSEDSQKTEPCRIKKLENRNFYFQFQIKIIKLFQNKSNRQRKTRQSLQYVRGLFDSGKAARYIPISCQEHRIQISKMRSHIGR